MGEGVTTQRKLVIYLASPDSVRFVEVPLDASGNSPHVRRRDGLPLEQTQAGDEIEVNGTMERVDSITTSLSIRLPIDWID